MEEGQSNKVTELHTKRNGRDGGAGASQRPPLHEDCMWEIIGRLEILDRQFGNYAGATFEERRASELAHADACLTERGRIPLVGIRDEVDALAAVQFLLGRVAEDAYECASPGNALEYHLLSQLSTYLHSRIKSPEGRP